MKKESMRNCFYFTMVACSIAAQCHGASCLPCPEPKKPDCEPCVEKCALKFYGTASLLCWKATADYLTYAFLNDSFSVDEDILNVIFKGKAVTSNFKFQPGYKLGFGVVLPKDVGDFYAEYTHFNSTVKSFQGTTTDPQQQIYAAWLEFVNVFLANVSFASASAIWKINLDTLDADFRNFSFTRGLFDFGSSFGLRALRLVQEYNLQYISLVTEDAPTSVTVNCFNKSSSRGIGPRVALHNALKFCLGRGKIFSDLGVSLLQVRDQVVASQTNSILEEAIPPLTDTISYQNTQTLTTLKPIVDLSLGAGWGLFICENKFLDLLLSYDYAFYWSQGYIQLGRAPLVAPGSPFQVLVGNSGENTGNLSFSGLKATVKLAF